MRKYKHIKSILLAATCISLISLATSCSLMCKCSYNDIYTELYNIKTFDGRYNNVHFPDLESLNIVSEGNRIIVDDTCITYYQDYMVYDHFTSVYECKYGRLNSISYLSLTWPESYIDKK